MGKFRRNALVALACAVLLAAVLVWARSAKSSPAVTIELGTNFGEFTLINQGGAISLDSAVRVQELADGKWRDAPVINLYLRKACSAELPKHCRTLQTGERSKGVSWDG
jgi:hypothetical protein